MCSSLRSSIKRNYIINPYVRVVLYTLISWMEQPLNGFLWLSFSVGIKFSVIHHPQNYLNNITSQLLAQERNHIVFSFFLYFSRENLSISCWLLDWLQRDSLKILKKIRNPVQIKHKLLSIMCPGHYVRFLLRKMSLKVAEINWCHWM